ncbi:MAG: hypothetical protein M1269_04800 [Chloroflexi bacterium]|nr:hypothetical protein [Chloroflexota bacterium]
MKFLKSKMTTILLLLVLALLLAFYVPGEILKGKIQKEITAARQKGEPVSIDEMIPGDVPPSENAAPLYSAAIELVEMYDLPKPEGDLLEYYRRNKSTVLDVLDKNRLTFELLEKGYKRPGCKYKLHYEDGFAMRIPNYMNVRSIARLSAFKAFHEIETGQYDKAAETLACALKFVRTLQPDIYLINQMIKVACRNILTEPLNLLAASGKAGKYPALQKEIREIASNGNNEMVLSLYGERATGIKAIKDVVNGKSEILKSEILNQMGSTSKPLSVYLELYMPGKPLLLYDELHYLRHWRKTLDAVDSGTSLPVYKSVPLCTFLSDIITPNMQRAVDNNRQTVDKYRELENKFSGK